MALHQWRQTGTREQGLTLQVVLRRDGRIDRWTFLFGTLALAITYFLVLWLGCAFLMIVSGGHPSALLTEGVRWPVLPAIWYGICGVAFVAGSTNLFFNRLHDTRLPQALSAAIWGCLALGLFSCADMTMSLVSATAHQPYYFVATWGVLNFVLSIPAPRDGDRSNAHWSGRSIVSSPVGGETNGDQPADWLKAAEADIEAYVSQTSKPKQQVQPLPLQSKRVFGKRKSTPSA